MDTWALLGGFLLFIYILSRFVSIRGGELEVNENTLHKYDFIIFVIAGPVGWFFAICCLVVMLAQFINSKQ